nr:enoyl-CoA-hydratase DpgD [Kineosporia sp. NBRC 101677]
MAETAAAGVAGVAGVAGMAGMAGMAGVVGVTEVTEVARVTEMARVAGVTAMTGVAGVAPVADVGNRVEAANPVEVTNPGQVAEPAEPVGVANSVTLAGVVKLAGAEPAPAPDEKWGRQPGEKRGPGLDEKRGLGRDEKRGRGLDEGRGPGLEVEPSTVRYEKRGAVAWVTLNRPRVLNAMNLQMHAELARVWDCAEADDEVRVVVLTGAGERAFSVGQDLTERARLTREGAGPSSFGSRGLPGWPRLTERFGFTKPVLARVQGYALGGGFELALACDIVVASETAQFGLPEVKLGLVPGAGGVFRLARQAPLKAAMGHLLTGRRMDAFTAARYGLVNEVVAADRLDACVDEWLADLLEASPLAAQAVKEAALQSLDLPLEQAFRTRFSAEERRLASDEPAEGVAAFVQKRPPRWSARLAGPSSPEVHQGGEHR